MRHILDAELGRAQGLCRYRLSIDKNDLVPAWALSQIVRVHKSCLLEYKANVAPVVLTPTTPPIILYRFLICRLAFLDYLDKRRNDKTLYQELDRNLILLREQCQSFAKQRLGFAISVTNSVPFWVLSDRSILESFVSNHPKGTDLRPLLCRAYLNGVISFDSKERWPDSPNPQKALGVARSILNDHPQDPLGLYYLGRSWYDLHRTDLAKHYIGLALGSGKLPDAFEQTAHAFLQHPGSEAFHIIKPFG